MLGVLSGVYRNSLALQGDAQLHVHRRGAAGRKRNVASLESVEAVDHYSKPVRSGRNSIEHILPLVIRRRDSLRGTRVNQMNARLRDHCAARISDNPAKR